MTDDFLSKLAAQNVPIAAQIRALRAVRTSNPMVFRKFLMLQIVCGLKCGEPVVEVFDTSPYKSICYWDVADLPGDKLPANAPLDARIARMQSSPARIRRGDSRFLVVSDTELREPDWTSVLFPACKCRTRTLTMTFIADAVASGNRKVVLRG